MRILHLSDNHGVLYPLRFTPGTDVVIHTGDMFPNSGRSSAERRLTEALYQDDWIARNADRIKIWLQGRPMIYIPGNHDYTDGQDAFLASGIDATCISGRTIDLNGLSVYGFPYVKDHENPRCVGVWNRGLQPPEMRVAIAAIPECDILLSHGPPYGILDSNGYESVGCNDMATALTYGTLRPFWFLCGHIHESHGISAIGDDGRTIVSNAATSQQILDLST